MPLPTRAVAGSVTAAYLIRGDVTRMTDRWWCEEVTVPFVNTGGPSVHSGTVTFATPALGALGTG